MGVEGEAWAAGGEGRQGSEGGGGEGYGSGQKGERLPWQSILKDWMARRAAVATPREKDAVGREPIAVGREPKAFGQLSKHL